MKREMKEEKEREFVKGRKCLVRERLKLFVFVMNMKTK